MHRTMIEGTLIKPPNLNTLAHLSLRVVRLPEARAQVGDRAQQITGVLCGKMVPNNLKGKVSLLSWHPMARNVSQL